MKAIKIILITLATLIGLFIVVGLFLPSEMHLEKSIEIDTPPNVPYMQVANLKNMSEWDPWSKIDSNMVAKFQVHYLELIINVNNDVGVGSMTITKSTQFEYIDSDLNFGDQGLATSYYKFEKLGDNKIKVTWGFDSDMDTPILGGYISFFMGFVIEAQYEQGLKTLKSVSKAIENKRDLSGAQISFEEVKSQKVICISGATTQDDQNVSSLFGKNYGQLMSNVQVNEMEQAGARMTINTKWEDNKYEFMNCIPVEDVKGELSASVEVKDTYAGPTAKIIHTGPYADMEKTYEDIRAFTEQSKFEIVGNPWEVYVNDPGNTPEDKLITHIYFPIK
jgi:effector-binding domain-containing protein